MESGLILSNNLLKLVSITFGSRLKPHLPDFTTLSALLHRETEPRHKNWVFPQSRLIRYDTPTKRMRLLKTRLQATRDTVKVCNRAKRRVYWDISME